MNSLAAALLALTVQLAFVICVVAVLWTKRAGSVPALALAIAGTALLAGQFGLFSRGDIPKLAVLTSRSTDAPTRQACLDVAAKLRDAGVIEEERDDGTVVVDALIWNQIPAQVRSGVQICLTELAPAGSSIKIIPR